jgi:hypothetical protein
MPEVEFTIDTETGKSETEIKGIQGPACEQAARRLKRLLGSPAVDQKTKEYHAKALLLRRIESK